MCNYFEKKEFNECSPSKWDEFCLQSENSWLWHTHSSILSKEFWYNHYNCSFYIIDNSNKQKIVAIFPLFLVKRRKIINYSTFESLGGPAYSTDLNETKLKKVKKVINDYLESLLKRNNANKCEIVLSSLSNIIINNKKLIPNPLGFFINNDKSSFTYIKNLNYPNHELFNSLSHQAKYTIKKNSQKIYFKLINSYNESKRILKVYLNLHRKMTVRKKINTLNEKYFEHIFLEFPKKYKKIFYLKNSNKILAISIFGVFKNKVSYWANVSEEEGLKIGSNYILMWKVIQYFKKKKIEHFEFGEGFYPYDKKELLYLNHFKRSFGAEKIILFKGDKILSKNKDLVFNILKNTRDFIFK